MDEMTAFDQQIAREVLREAGPSEPVDAAAIFSSMATATQSPKWRFQTMFSATKFVVAGVIVALFGGFLLAGVLTQPSDEMAPAAVTASPSPVTTEELLSGMVTEEVEPGVLRIRDDAIEIPRCAWPGHQSHRQGLAVQGRLHVRARAGCERGPVERRRAGVLVRHGLHA